jgi:hypothetical protein
MGEVEMMQEQLIATIEQRLEDLMVYDEDLAYQYDCDLYYADNMDQPIVELFTPQLLQEIEHHIEKLDQ